jgi:ketosteroid isomerase-like protein
MSSTGDNKTLVLAYFDAIAASNFERVASMMTPDLVFRCAGGTGASDSVVFRSPEALVVDLRHSMRDLYDPEFGLRPEVRSLTAEEERVVAEVRIEGRSIQTGEPYDNLYAFFFWVEDGRFKRIHEHLDTAYVGRTLLQPAGIETGADMPWLDESGGDA